MKNLLSLLLIGWSTLALGCSSEAEVTTQCCALRQFCSVCSTCDSSEISIGDSGDEVACQQINDNFIDVGRFCHPGDDPPSRSIEEDIASCASE